MKKYSDKEWEEQKFEEPDLSGTYSAAEFINWPVGYLVELIRGKPYKMSPAPSVDHQRVLRRLTVKFDNCFSGKKCEFFFAPFDVFLVKPGENWAKARNVVEPDLVVICDKKKIAPFGCIGSPDFVVEVLSPNNKRKDLKIKRELYREYEIPEYWIVDPIGKEVYINLLDENGNYIASGPFRKEKILSPGQFPMLKIKTDEIFKGI